MGLRPQALYGIADSPVGIAGYFLDHDARSLLMISRAFDGQPEGLTRDDVLDNVTLTWLTNTFVSGARLYWECLANKISFFGVKGVSIPVAVSVFPDELYPAPRSWAEQAYPNLIHYNKLEKGGHFAAWEQPELFAKNFAPPSNRFVHEWLKRDGGLQSEPDPTSRLTKLGTSRIACITVILSYGPVIRWNHETHR